jgi:hypothetical protein
MTWDWTIKVSDIAIMIATMLGPILAVQAQKYLERHRDRRDRQSRIFHTLMNTRAETLSAEHVQGLNSVPLEFQAKRGPQREIIDAWNVYLDHLNSHSNDLALWGEKRVDLFVELLGKMATFLGYDFDPVQIKKGFYSPQGHAMLATEQETIRTGLAKLFRGEAPLPMAVISWPDNAEGFALQRDQQQLVVAWLKGEIAPPVTLKSSTSTSTASSISKEARAVAEER